VVEELKRVNIRWYKNSLPQLLNQLKRAKGPESLTMHFKYLLAAGLHKNLSLRQVLFVNLDTESVIERRARNLFPKRYVDSNRIAFNKLPFSDFVARQHDFGDRFGLHRLGRETEHGLNYDYFGPRG
jgi:hypothetical protein